MSTPASTLRKGQLPVHSKELLSVTIVKHRPSVWRHDVWPFLVLYLLDVCAVGYYASRYEWCDIKICAHRSSSMK